MEFGTFWKFKRETKIKMRQRKICIFTGKRCEEATLEEAAFF